MYGRRLVVAALTTVGVLACGGGDDKTPPAAPTLDAVAGAVKDNPYGLKGSGEAGAQVQVRGGADPVAKGTVGGDGKFSVPVKLKADTSNHLFVSLVDAANNEGPATEIDVVHDGTPPESPTLDPVTSPTRRTNATIRGTSQGAVSVKVTGGQAETTGEVDASGHFAVDVTLNTSLSQQVSNELTVVATDAAGNESGPVKVTVVFDSTVPVEAPQLDTLKNPTNQATIALTGTAEPSVGINVVGGDQPVTGNADASGKFNVSVKLHENATNRLYVFAVGNGQTSSPATIDLVHDGIAPAPPTVDPTSSPTAAASATLTGQTEPFAKVTAKRGDTSTDATADERGRYSVAVPLQANAQNDIAVTATDKAGNESEATNVSVKHDSNLPVAPTLDPYRSPTTENPIVLTGKTDPSTSITVTGGAAPATTTSAADGAFTVQVNLTPNTTNELHVARTGSTGEALAVIVHDNIAPSQPALNAVASPTNKETIDVTGTTEPSAKVAVTGGVAAASSFAESDGRFTVSVQIPKDADTTLAVVATDSAGNTSPPATVHVKQSSSAPSAPVIDQPNPAPTKSATYVLTGRVTQPAPNTTIHVTGGAADVDGTTNPGTGAFSVTVNLTPNSANALSVTSKVGDIESPPALVTVVHDNTPPPAPDAAKITIGAPGSCLVFRSTSSITGAAGSVEGKAKVTITNATASATTTVTATDAGAFTASISACSGESLKFVATDAAGNASAATTKAAP